MSIDKLPKDLKDELNRVAFKGNPKDFANTLSALSGPEILSLFPEEKKRYEVLKEIALQSKADTFEKLLTSLGGDETSVRALVDGFKADERYHNSRDVPGYDDRFGMGGYNRTDLEMKREALRRFAVLLNKGANIAPPPLNGK